MIGREASKALDALYRQALSETCGAVQVAASKVDEIDTDPVLLSIASYQFRLATLLCLEDTPPMRQLLTRLLRSPVVLEGAAFADGRAELTNMICGAVNRGLARAFHHVGMSTPLSVSRTCLEHLDLLQAAYSGAYRVQCDEAGFDLLLCLSLTRDGAFDFVFSPETAHDDAGVGELELF